MSDKAPIRIANCSGFLGDRASAAKEMVEGGPIDVLTGDWLAELTMLILARIRAKHPGGGFARPFVQQMEQVMGTCLDRNIKVVSNAGGLDPRGCAEAVEAVATELGLSPKVAWVDGDDLSARLGELSASGQLTRFGNEPSAGLELSDDDVSAALTANAYLGCWGIVEALGSGADIVITGRVTDAAVVCGPAAWHHGWDETNLDQLAGAVAAGHVIECGAQATGGNYSFFNEIEGRTDQSVRFGFPWADIATDGSSVIGKHDGTGGVVNVETVTSQLLYEIGGPRYLGPDVTTRFDTIELEQVADDRVRLSGAVGEPPPATLKVSMNRLGGFRNTASVALTGLDIDEKAAFAQATFWNAYPYAAEDLDEVESRVERTEHADPASQAEATAVWRITAKDSDEAKVGRAFTDAMVQTTLSSIPGMYSPDGAPGRANPYGVFVPAKVDRSAVTQAVHFGVGKSMNVEDRSAEIAALAPVPSPSRSAAQVDPPDIGGELVDVELGRIVGTRSGDKGGDANLGVYPRNEAGWRWLRHFLTIERLKELLPEATDLEIDRYEFSNLWSLNFVLKGFLGEGVAASTRLDPQAKALGEWLRARVVSVPPSVVDAKPEL